MSSILLKNHNTPQSNNTKESSVLPSSLVATCFGHLPFYANNCPTIAPKKGRQNNYGIQGFG